MSNPRYASYPPAAGAPSAETVFTDVLRVLPDAVLDGTVEVRDGIMADLQPVRSGSACRAGGPGRIGPNARADLVPVRHRLAAFPYIVHPGRESGHQDHQCRIGRGSRPRARLGIAVWALLAAAAPKYALSSYKERSATLIREAGGKAGSFQHSLNPVSDPSWLRHSLPPTPPCARLIWAVAARYWMERLSSMPLWEITRISDGAAWLRMRRSESFARLRPASVSARPTTP